MKSRPAALRHPAGGMTLERPRPQPVGQHGNEPTRRAHHRTVALTHGREQRWHRCCSSTDAEARAPPIARRRAPGPRPTRGRRQRSRRARCFTNAGVVCLMQAGVAMSRTASVTDAGPPRLSVRRPGVRSRIRPREPAAASRTELDPMRALDAGHVRERAFSDVSPRLKRAVAIRRTRVAPTALLPSLTDHQPREWVEPSAGYRAYGTSSWSRSACRRFTDEALAAARAHARGLPRHRRAGALAAPALRPLRVVKFSASWRWSVSAMWRSGLADDEAFAGGLDDLARDRREVVDRLLARHRLTG
jgi:hypothetical protein